MAALNSNYKYKKQKMTRKIILLMCPNVKNYPVPPSDQPGCEKKPCPFCNKKMWVSEKKRAITLELSEEKIVIACYPCIKLAAEIGFLTEYAVKSVKI